MISSNEITQLLREVRGGSKPALERLLPLVYDELRQLASRYLQQEYQQRTFQTTELVHEAYIRLIGSDISWENRAHFFGIAARSMRQILVAQARRRNAEKRGGEFTRVSLAEGILLSDETDGKLLALEEALTRLETFDERLCRIIELRFFTGLSIEETAEAMLLSAATIKREWAVAKAWLQREIGT
ncbi:MAG: sigma-70 family RNA polymerase sigma factor [Ignavibacteriae bacterium]|nr:sigma-70 family RNA polymerase sigma factor [Ignavibacteriota bacterium]